MSNTRISPEHRRHVEATDRTQTNVVDVIQRLVDQGLDDDALVDRALQLIPVDAEAWPGIPGHRLDVVGVGSNGRRPNIRRMMVEAVVDSHAWRPRGPIWDRPGSLTILEGL